jgi:hypothetical protein
MTVSSTLFAPIVKYFNQTLSTVYCSSDAELHHCGGAGAVTRCGSGSRGSCFKTRIKHRQFLNMSQTATVSYLYSTLVFTFTTILIIQNVENKI